MSGCDFCSYLRQPLEPLRTLARLGYYLQEGLWGSGCFFCSYLRHPLDPLRTWLLSARKGLGCGVLGLARFGFCSYLRHHLDRPTLATLGYYQTCEKGPGVWGRVWGFGVLGVTSALIWAGPHLSRLLPVLEPTELWSFFLVTLQQALNPKP